MNSDKLDSEGQVDSVETVFSEEIIGGEVASFDDSPDIGRPTGPGG